MPARSPIYTADNCTPAYQLDWSVTLFWRGRRIDGAWLAALRAALEPDGIRVLQHRFSQPLTSLFLVSTKPHVAPSTLVARLKGRLQHLVAGEHPKAFHRNFAVRSIGSTTREKLDAYLAKQLVHHRMADQRVADLYVPFQIHLPEIDLSTPQFSSHGPYWYNLHWSIVTDGRWRGIHDRLLAAIHDMMLKASAAKRHRLSRAAILPDHLHVLLSCQPSESPAEVVLSYMNNLAYAWRMEALFQYSYFVGTFGEYDLGAVVQKPASIETSSKGTRRDAAGRW